MSFDNYAKNWDTDIRISRAKIIANEIKSILNYSKNSKALEFGCGTGLISFNLRELFKDITLVDTSKNMITIVNDKIKKYNIHNMNTHNLDITADKKNTGKYDIIYSSMVLHHILDTENIIKEFYELLNDNGELCIVDLNKEDGKFHKKELDFKGHNGFFQEQLKNILLNKGFKKIEMRTFFHGEKNIDNQKINYSLFIMKAKK